jgi:cell division protein FtsN
MAAARRRRRRRGAGRGWLVLTVILAAALAAGGFYWWRMQAPVPAPAGAVGEPVAAPAKPARRPKPAAPTEDPGRFEFYDMLPDQQVAVPPPPDNSRRGPPPTVEPPPGIYVIQAGPFADFAQADAVKARLAMLGIVSQIQQITVDGRTFQRVRVGPIEDTARLKRMRDQLRANRIDHDVVLVTE